MTKFSPTKLNQTEFLTNKGINSYLLTEGALDFSPTKRNLLLILEILTNQLVRSATLFNLDCKSILKVHQNEQGSYFFNSVLKCFLDCRRRIWNRFLAVDIKPVCKIRLILLPVCPRLGNSAPETLKCQFWLLSALTASMENLSRDQRDTVFKGIKACTLGPYI